MLNFILQISAANFLKVQFQFQNGSTWNLGHRVILYFPDNFTVMDSQNITSSGTYTYNDTYQYLQEGVKYSILLCREDNGFEITMAQLSAYHINSSLVVKVPDYILIVTLQDINTSAALSGINVGLVGSSYSVATNTSGSAKLYLSDIQTGNVTLNFSDPACNYFVGLQDFVVKQGVQGVTYSREKCQKQQFYVQDASGPLKDVNISITNSDGAYRGWFLTGVDGTVLATWDQDNVHTIAAVISKYGQSCYVPQSQTFTVSATTRQNFTLIKGICTTLTINLLDGEEQLYNVQTQVADSKSYPYPNIFISTSDKQLVIYETQDYEMLLINQKMLYFSVQDPNQNYVNQTFGFVYTMNMSMNAQIKQIIVANIMVQDVDRNPIENVSIIFQCENTVIVIETNSSGLVCYNMTNFDHSAAAEYSLLIQSDSSYIGFLYPKVYTVTNQNHTILLKPQNPSNFFFTVFIKITDSSQIIGQGHIVYLYGKQFICEEQTNGSGVAAIQFEEQSSHADKGETIQVQVYNKQKELEGIGSFTLAENTQEEIVIGRHVVFYVAVFQNDFGVSNANVTVYYGAQYLTSNLTNSSGVASFDVSLSITGLSMNASLLISTANSNNQSITLTDSQTFNITIDENINKIAVICGFTALGIILLCVSVAIPWVLIKKIVKRAKKQENKVMGTMVQMSGIIINGEEQTKEQKILIQSKLTDSGATQLTGLAQVQDDSENIQNKVQ